MVYGQVAGNGTWTGAVSWEGAASWLSMLSTSLAILAAILNTFTILVIVRLRPAAYKPRLRLNLSLTLTDLMISVEVILFFIINGRSVLYDSSESSLRTYMSFILKFLEMCGILLCFMNLLAIAVDQLISVVLPMKYISIVTGTRMNRVVIVMWVSTFITMALPITGNCLASQHSSTTVCVSVGRNYASIINAVVCMTSLPAFLVIYAVIYGRIRRLRRSSSNTNRTFSMRKAIVTSTILVIPFILIYFPVSVYVSIIWTLNIHTTWPFWELLIVLLTLNTVTDPVIYAVRMQSIRRGYKNLVFGKEPSNWRHTSWNTSTYMNG